MEDVKACNELPPHSHCPHVDCPDCPGLCQEQIQLRLYTVYCYPFDPGPTFAVQEFRIEPGHEESIPGPVLARGLETLDKARTVVPPWADTFLTRDPTDDPTIVETWF